jgi:hypothetical protein
MRQKFGEKWAAAVDLQPATSKSDRLLGRVLLAFGVIGKLFLAHRPGSGQLGQGDIFFVGGAAKFLAQLAGVLRHRRARVAAVPEGFLKLRSSASV